MKKLTIKEMTPSEQLDVKTQLDSARIRHGRPLTNSEQNKIKGQAIDKIMKARDSIMRAQKAKAKSSNITPGNGNFNWASSIKNSRPYRQMSKQ